MTAAQSRPRNATLPLLCALGRHKTDLLVRWNDGYYFTRCRRCGLDLVRTAFSGWTAPKRYRVVWQAEPPASVEQVGPAPQAEAEPAAVAAPASEPQTDAPPADTLQDGQVEFPIREPAPAAPVGPSMTDEAFAARPAHDDSGPESTNSDASVPHGWQDDGGALPIEDVLQSLRAEPEAPDVTPRVNQEGEDDAWVDRRSEFAEEPRPSAPPSPPRAKYPVIPDFMDEEFPGITWDPSTGRMISDDTDKPQPSSKETKAGWRDTIREKAQAATASGMERLRPRTPTAPAPREAADEPSAQPQPSSPATPSRSFLERHGGLVAATVFGGFVLAAAIVDGRNDGSDRIAYRPQLRTQEVEVRPEAQVRSASIAEQRTASVAVRPAAGGNDAFVTASLLNCRAVPTNDGETVRRLERGDAVKVLGADPGWVSVSHQGRQCWASSQWISTVKPL